MRSALRLDPSEHELASGDKGHCRLCAAGRAGADISTLPTTRVTPPTRSGAEHQCHKTPTPRDHKPHQIYAEASGAAAALASALRFALARALDLRASACSVNAFSRAFSPLSLWIASMSTRLFLYWLPFAAM